MSFLARSNILSRFGYLETSNVIRVALKAFLFCTGCFLFRDDYGRAERVDYVLSVWVDNETALDGAWRVGERWVWIYR